MKRGDFCLFLIALFLCFKNAIALPPSKIITIESGTSSGNYFTIASSLCELVNKKNNPLFRCVARTTEGTNENINLVLTDNTTIGLGQADVITASENTTKLNFVLRLNIEPVFVIASKNSDAKTFTDIALQNKINLGSKNSGESQTAKNLLQEFQIKRAKFGESGRYEISSLLCTNRIDIAFIVDANISNFVNDILDFCDARLISMDDNFINSFIAKNKNFESFIIQKNTYKNQYQDIKTIATETILFASEDTPSEVVKAFLEAIFTDFGGVRGVDQSFKTRVREDFFVNKTTLKMHDGAKEFLNKE
jgi:TRAP transporter TAXI family solute receptor